MNARARQLGVTEAELVRNAIDALIAQTSESDDDWEAFFREADDVAETSSLRTWTFDRAELYEQRA